MDVRMGVKEDVVVHVHTVVLAHVPDLVPEDAKADARVHAPLAVLVAAVDIALLI